MRAICLNCQFCKQGTAAEPCRRCINLSGKDDCFVPLENADGSIPIEKAPDNVNHPVHYQRENIEHSMVNDFQPKGLTTYKGKFTAEQREEIKLLWDEGEKSKREIAKMYGVSHTCICDIVNDKYKYAESVNIFEEVARPIVDTLNELRDSYLRCIDAKKKKSIWYSILQLLPESYNQHATVLLNYEVLRNACQARKNHKLDEWHEFCKWAESLPYSELILEV